MAGGVRGSFVEHKDACCMCSCFVRQWIKDDTERRTNWFDKITGVSVARKSSAAPVVSASCLAVSLFSLWRPQVTGHRWNSDSIFKTWTNWLWFRCQGTLCVSGTSLFWKVPTWTCSNQPFFQHMLWENTPPALHNSLAPYTYTMSKESARGAQQLGSDIWIQSLNDVTYRPNLTEFRACWSTMLGKHTAWKERNCLTQHWCYLFRKNIIFLGTVHVSSNCNINMQEIL